MSLNGPQQHYGPSIIIIGSGMAGLAISIAIKYRLGYNNFKIYEKAGDIGGTWRENIYPGSSSDTPIHLYCLPSDMNPNWEETHGYQPEILAYLKDIVDKRSLAQHIVLNRKVIGAVWDENEKHYMVKVENSITGENEFAAANIIISATGILEIPKVPSFVGMGKFKGKMFHSSKWEKGLDLSGKRVAVIGNGTSGSQAIPEIVKLPGAHVTHICRSKSWYLPPIRFPVSERTKWWLRRFPFLMRCIRLWQYLETEAKYPFIFHNSFLRNSTTKAVKKFMLQSSPERYHKDIIPSYPLGCKRAVFDMGYMDALHRENLELLYGEIAEITPEGIRMESGSEFTLDVIIFATGFEAFKYPIDICGSSGMNVQEYYETRGGPEGYNGALLPGFPNFMFVSGPNTVTGYIPITTFNNIQVEYFLQLLKPLIEGRILSLEVKKEASESYNKKIQNKFAGSVFEQCRSPYRIGGTGKHTFLFPSWTPLFWWWLLYPVWDDFKTEGTFNSSAAKNREKLRAVGSILLGITAVILSALLKP
ncbi:hypothetical protein BDQ17DRAFT_1355394 [Cyathus striatus]|nr:hypothetical protein BDQ17DRAFT_1355394 [Cyathus striatus]